MSGSQGSVVSGQLSVANAKKTTNSLDDLAAELRMLERQLEESEEHAARSAEQKTRYEEQRQQVRAAIHFCRRGPNPFSAQVIKSGRRGQ